jgi:hypothetical protein
MVDAVKKSGWSKSVFYNISESPSYAGAVANAGIDGVSFQWCPTGLVANRFLKGNCLPNVGVYKIPFGDTITAYRNKARMVYEFDAGDVAHDICILPWQEVSELQDFNGQRNLLMILWQLLMLILNTKPII